MEGIRPSIHPSTQYSLVQYSRKYRLAFAYFVLFLIWAQKMEVGGVDEGRHLLRRGVCLYMQLGDDDDL